MNPEKYPEKETDMTKYAVMNDETLVEICLLGESGAFEELVMRHENAVMNTAKRVTGSRFTAEDASQDAFVSAWMRLDSLRDRSKFKPWVCAIAKNCAMALLTRYRSVVPDISLHLVENEEMADNPDPEPTRPRRQPHALRRSQAPSGKGGERRPGPNEVTPCHGHDSRICYRMEITVPFLVTCSI